LFRAFSDEIAAKRIIYRGKGTLPNWPCAQTTGTYTHYIESELTMISISIYSILTLKM
jgi:hypothetical protein